MELKFSLNATLHKTRFNYVFCAYEKESDQYNSQYQFVIPLLSGRHVVRALNSLLRALDSTVDITIWRLMLNIFNYIIIFIWESALLLEQRLTSLLSQEDGHLIGSNWDEFYLLIFL